MNRRINHHTWEENLINNDGPLAEFCGHVALEQLKDDLDFVNEQPTGSDMYSLMPWPQVCSHPRVSKESFDQCQLGQRDSKRETSQETYHIVGI